MSEYRFVTKEDIEKEAENHEIGHLLRLAKRILAERDAYREAAVEYRDELADENENVFKTVDVVARKILEGEKYDSNDSRKGKMNQTKCEKSPNQEHCWHESNNYGGINKSKDHCCWCGKSDDRHGEYA